MALVRQYRKALGRFLLEIVAGTREQGESAESCAIREVREETGYKVSSVIPLGHIYTAPGFCNEKITLFYAQARQAPGAGHLDPDEKITVKHLTIAQFAGLAARGAVQDAKTLAAWSLVQMRLPLTKRGGQS